MMKKAVQFRFWLEAVLASLTGLLFLVTLVMPEWIEILFGIEPDAGSGSLEWLVVGTLLILTITLATLARLDWRRLQTAGQNMLD